MVTVTFIDMQSDDSFELECGSVQLTGTMLRDDNDCTIANLESQGWRAEDGRVWGDITISTTL